jgi:chromosome segregation ATPase
MSSKINYYTQTEAASLINVSESSIKLYIKELSDDEKEGKFNDKNQPNDLGIQALLSIAEDRNPYLKKYKEYEKIINDKDNEIKYLKNRIELLENKNKELNKRYIEYSEKVSNRFGELQEQSNIIIAQLSKNNDQLQKLSEPIKKEQSFVERLKGLFTGK